MTEDAANSSNPTDPPTPLRAWWLTRMACVALISLLGAMWLDRAIDSTLVICAPAAASANTECIASSAAPGEHWVTSARRYAVQSGTAVNSIVLVTKLLLYVAFAAVSLELVLHLLKLAGVPAVTLKTFRDKFEQAGKKGAKESGDTESRPKRWGQLIELAFNPQFAVTVVAMFTVGTTVIKQVDRIQERTIIDPAAIASVEAQVAALQHQVSAVHGELSTAHGEVTTLRAALVSYDADQLAVPAASPNLSAAISGMRDDIKSTSSDTGVRLGALRGSVDKFAEEQRKHLSDPPPGDLAPKLVKFDQQLASANKRLDAVTKSLCGNATTCVDLPTHVASLYSQGESIGAGIGSVKQSVGKTQEIAQETRKVLGRLPPIGTKSTRYDTIAGGIYRLIELEHEWAQNRWRWPMNDELQRLLEKAPYTKTACEDDLKNCLLGAQSAGAATNTVSQAQQESPGDSQISTE